MKKRLWKNGVLALVVALISFTATITTYGGELSNKQAFNALWIWIPGGASIRVIGVQPMPQLGGANVDFYATNIRIRLNKSDMAYGFSPGGNTIHWTGNGHAVFKHYNSGWVLSGIVLGGRRWSNLNIKVK